MEMNAQQQPPNKTCPDETFRVKFEELPGVLRDWMGSDFPWTEAEVMDFGCGQGDMALGVACQLGCRRVVGTDIGAEFRDCRRRASSYLGMSDLPENLVFRRTSPGRLDSRDDRFDLIYSWSVLEHVDQRFLEGTIEALRTALKAGGYLFVQIAPLYYSAEGAHLSHKIPEPWGHLTNQSNIYRMKLHRSCPTPDEFKRLWSTFNTLNRITADQLESLLAEGGFRILRRYTTQCAAEPPAALLAVYREVVLRTEQIVLLAQRD
ncbi:class I SAM-dependent methyltransferase [Methylolobus aquaticus]